MYQMKTRLDHFYAFCKLRNSLIIDSNKIGKKSTSLHKKSRKVKVDTEKLKACYIGEKQRKHLFLKNVMANLNETLFSVIRSSKHRSKEIL